MMKVPYTKLISAFCLLLAVLLMVSACAPRTQPSPSAEASQAVSASEEPVEPKQSPGGEHEPSEPESLEPESEWAFSEEEPFPGDLPETADTPAIQPSSTQEGAGVYSPAAQSIVPLSLNGGAVTPQLNLTIPQTFSVSRPQKAITTTLAAYYIMGTSNPSAPLYFDGQEVERLGTKGVWGVYVQLALGTNNFSVRQGDQTVTVSITRRAVPGVQPISIITAGSMYPAVQGGVKVGQNLAVECVAPSGATVTATFEGKTVTLQQVANANSGVPATFKGEIPVGTDYPAGVTTKVGKVSYQLTWGGKTTKYQSQGDVFVAGSGSYIAVRVTAYQGLVYDDPKMPGVFREKLRTGAADYVYSEDNAYYRLYSGGYIPKSLCEIVEGEVRIGNKITSVSTSIHEDGERYTFHGIATPAYRVGRGEGNTFVLTTYNTNGTQPVNVSSSRLFSGVRSTANQNNSVSYVFDFKNTGRYWGYLVQFDGNDLVLSFQYKPTLSGGSTPLKGVKIMLDPGHGGHDPGALGFSGTKGPDENTLNLANAYAVRNKLTALGAEVVFTRSRLDEYLSLDERLQSFEESGAHLFLSLHHNSLGESSDGNKTTGTEIYYHTNQSATAAARLVEAYTTQVNRINRGAKNGYYRVTLLPQSPSMLLEMGFICHPVEYENLTNPAVIEQSAQGIANGILAALR